MALMGSSCISWCFCMSLIGSCAVVTCHVVRLRVVECGSPGHAEGVKGDPGKARSPLQLRSPQPTNVGAPPPPPPESQVTPPSPPILEVPPKKSLCGETMISNVLYIIINYYIIIIRHLKSLFSHKWSQ